MPAVKAAAAATEDAGSDLVDVRLFKAIGLYSVMEPVPDSRRALKYRKAFAACVWLMLGTCVTQLGALYFMLKDFERLSQIVLVVNVSLTTCSKGYVLVRHPDRMWRVLELARYTFTTSGRRDPSELIRCRSALATLGRTFVALNYCVLFVWLSSPFFIREPLRVVHRDGTVAEHRAAVQNLWTPLSDDTYNSTPCWTIIYCFEVYIGAFNVFVWVIFDCYMMAVCLVLNAQFRTVTAAYQTLGNRRHRDHSTTTGHYDDLVCYIEDNQRIIG